MGETTKIQWTDHTFNVAWGRTKVSPGCANCYAEKDAHRYGFDVWGKGTERRTFGDKHWAEPLKWNREAAREGRRHRVFCSSMADVFEDHPTIEALLPRLRCLINDTPNLDWQILTKRAERMLDLWPVFPVNAWAGVSVESNDYIHRINALRKVDAVIRFVSFEPILGPVTGANLRGIHWAIFGGESQSGARPCDVEWIRGGIAACRHEGAAPFVKQLGRVPMQEIAPNCDALIDLRDRKGGDMEEWPADLRVREFPAVRNA